MPIDASADDASFVADPKKRQPLLGHVSMLTDFTILPAGDTIITCDRDEHIRLSRWPEGYDIIQYLFGHTKCVRDPRERPPDAGHRAVASLLLLPDNKLLSAGADSTLFLWDLATHALLKQIPIGLVAGYSVVTSPRAEQRKARRESKPLKKRKRRKGQLGGEIDCEIDASMEAAESAGLNDTGRSILIKKMLQLDGQRVLLLASGCVCAWSVRGCSP
jgi:hypothetical protein